MNNRRAKKFKKLITFVHYIRTIYNALLNLVMKLTIIDKFGKNKNKIIYF